MALPNIFSKEISEQVINRINTLTPATKALWGKMTVDQMLAHCAVSYEMAYENKHPKPGSFARFMLKLFVKKVVVNEQPYGKSGRTAPAFVVTDQRDFEAEKVRLIAYIRKTAELGEKHFNGKESLSFGVLNSNEWNNLFYKHIDHHLKQFAA